MQEISVELISSYLSANHHPEMARFYGTGPGASRKTIQSLTARAANPRICSPLWLILFGGDVGVS